MDEDLSEEKVIKQLDLANYVHKILLGYPNDANTRIKCKLGKYIEKIKYEIRNSEKNLNYLLIKENKNPVDEFLINNGEKIINKCIEVIEKLRDVDYLGLLRRSMNKREIAIGNIDGSNIRLFEAIEIGSISEVSYNLIEEDIYVYLRRISRKNNIDNDKLINYFIEKNYLTSESKKYIELLLCFPYDVMKYWKRYRKRGIEEKDILSNLERAFIMEESKNG